MYHYFQPLNEVKMEYVPEGDVVEECTSYLKLLLGVVLDCYLSYGRLIDPEQFFTIENLLTTDKTIEDFEEQAGYPCSY